MALTIIQQIVLGIIQGVTEWLPVSSSGINAIVMANVFKITDLGFLLQSALLLHLGTFFAALIYFRKDVWDLIRSLFNYKESDVRIKKVLKFLIISTVISGIIGLLILKGLTSFESYLEVTGRTITFFVGIFLLFTGFIQLSAKKIGLRKENHLENSEGFLLGFSQGLASLPGISRSGITVSALLLKKFDDTSALRLSFLMSLPIVLAGNIILNLPDFRQIITPSSFFGLIASFVFGLLTISGMMKLSKRINFGWFVLIFGLVMLGSLLVV